jgi:hypothetical protein
VTSSDTPSVSIKNVKILTFLSKKTVKILTIAKFEFFPLAHQEHKCKKNFVSDIYDFAISHHPLQLLQWLSEFKSIVLEIVWTDSQTLQLVVGWFFYALNKNPPFFFVPDLGIIVKNGKKTGLFGIYPL